MGTPEFSVPSFERLIRDSHKIAAVFTQPDKPAGRGKHLHASPVKAVALEHGLPVYQPAKIRINEEVRAIFEDISPDACVVVAYGKILPPWMLAIPRVGCINVHASLLPRYRGAAPINWAIANGEHETGVTIMQMDVGMDTGPMLAQDSISIGDNETAPELSRRLAELGAGLLSETLPRLERGDLRSRPQDDHEASYAPSLKREDGLINWRMEASAIANRVRAFQPWPGTYTQFRGTRFMIWRARPTSSNSVAVVDEPGTVLGIDSSSITIACAGSTVLAIEEIQIEGRRRISAREFASGAHLKPGDRINR